MKIYDFTSDRKMMSVIVRRVTDGKILIFTKGADEKLTPLASSSQNQVDLNSMRENVNTFAK